MTTHYTRNGSALCGSSTGDLGGIIDCADCTTELARCAEEDRVILEERSPDAMLLDILAHAQRAQVLVGVGPAGRRAQARWLDVEL